MYCSSDCRKKIIPSPPVQSALPNGFEVKNELDGIHYVKVAKDHIILAHITTECDIGGHENESGNLTVFLCQADETMEVDFTSYVMCIVWFSNFQLHYFCHQALAL